MPSWNGQGQIYLFQSLFHYLFFLVLKVHEEQVCPLLRCTLESFKALFTKLLVPSNCMNLLHVSLFPKYSDTLSNQAPPISFVTWFFYTIFTLYGTSSNEQPQLLFPLLKILRLQYLIYLLECISWHQYLCEKEVNIIPVHAIYGIQGEER